MLSQYYRLILTNQSDQPIFFGLVNQPINFFNIFNQWLTFMSPRSPNDDFLLEQLLLHGELLLLGVREPLGDRKPEGDPNPLTSPLCPLHPPREPAHYATNAPRIMQSTPNYAIPLCRPHKSAGMFKNMLRELLSVILIKSFFASKWCVFSWLRNSSLSEVLTRPQLHNESSSDLLRNLLDLRCM